MRWLILLLLAGCASVPSREVYVAWQPPCASIPDVRRVRFVDTAAPTLACIQAATGELKAQWVLLTLLGMPVSACTVTIGNTATIYAAISPSPSQVAIALATMRPPDELVQHELLHAFGAHHPALVADAWSCD